MARVLTAAGAERGLPQRITVDDGSEFTSRMLDHWAYWQHVALEFSRPGKPVDKPKPAAIRTGLVYQIRGGLPADPIRSA